MIRPSETGIIFVLLAGQHQPHLLLQLCVSLPEAFKLLYLVSAVPDKKTRLSD